MNVDSVFSRRLRAGVVFVILAGYCGLSGCSSDGTESAPKLKGSKDEIQKALQSGGAKPNTKGRAKRRD